jgi:regulator of replication initiation timing
MQTSRYSRIERSLMRILDQIDRLKEEIREAVDEEEKRLLNVKLKRLWILRSYYVQLILLKYSDN